MLASDVANEPLLVNGYVVYEQSQEPRLCTSLRESHPPQCGEPSLVVDGPELGEFGFEVESAGGTQWTEDEVQVLGLVRDGRITIEEAHR